jgi:hypothetical protein
VDVFNLFAEHEWDNEQEREGTAPRRGDRARLGGALLGGSLYELPPGESTWPYHYEHGSEEWLLVVAGRPTLRTPDGERGSSPATSRSFPRARGRAQGDERDRRGGARRDLLVEVAVRSRRVSRQRQGRSLDREDGYVGLVRDEPKLDYWDGE